MSNVTNESTGDALNEESQINDDDQDIATRIDQADYYRTIVTAQW